VDAFPTARISLDADGGLAASIPAGTTL